MSRQAWTTFVALAFIWGLPYFFIKIALHDLTPAWIAFARVFVGALLLIAFVPRTDWTGLRPLLPVITVVALTDVALPFYLIANGERFISSSLTGLLLSVMPIVVALLAFIFNRQEHLTRWQVTGLLVGVGGVATLIGFDVSHVASALYGAALIVGATISYSIGVLLIRTYLGDVPQLAATAAMLVVASIALLPAAVFHPILHRPSLAVYGAIFVLGAVCTAAAYVLYFALIARVGATRAAVVTYFNPVVAALLGVIFLGESIHSTAIAGLLLVIAGSWLSTGGTPPHLFAKRKKRVSKPA